MTTPPIIQGSPIRPQGSALAAVAPIFITVFLIVAIISTAITFILPESYASTARLKVEPDVSSSTNGMAYDPYFIQTTFEIIQSQLVLAAVIDHLNLNVEWGKKYFNGETLKTTETLEILKGRLCLSPVRGTKLIAITVYSDDRNEAARVANAIADAYVNYRVESAGKVDGSKAPAGPPVVITDRAFPGREPAKPNKPLNITLGLLAGAVLGLAAAALVGAIRSRLRTR